MKTRYSLVLIFSQQINPDRLLDVVDSCPQVTDWMTELVNCVFIESRFSADRLARYLIEKLKLIRQGPTKGNPSFLIMEYDQAKAQGYLPLDAWALLNQDDS